MVRLEMVGTVGGLCKCFWRVVFSGKVSERRDGGE